MREPSVVNVVVKADLGCEVNMDYIRLGLGEDAEFNPADFPAIIYRPHRKEKGKETILLFKTGRLVCTGADSAEKGKRLVQEFIQRLVAIGVQIPEPPQTAPLSACELDEKVMQILGVPETVYTNYCLYADSWATPKGDAGGFVRRWVDRGQIRLELESLTTGDIRQILDKIGILTNRETLNVLRCVTDEKMTLQEIAEAIGIGEERVSDCLDVLRKARLQWGPTGEEQTYESWGGRVILHLLSMMQRLVLEPSDDSMVGGEELYK